MHEYSIVGHRRVTIAMYVAFISGAAASSLTFLAVLLIKTFTKLEWIGDTDFIVWPITGGVLFGILFWLFDQSVWKYKFLQKVVGIPRLAGDWDVEGQSFDEKEQPTFSWSGTISITQRYEKLIVKLKTETSNSNSISAALVPEGDVFRLIYSYRNEPRPGEPELKSHLGHCELTFDRDVLSADGAYFNGFGRGTHGTMHLRRKEQKP